VSRHWGIISVTTAEEGRTMTRHTPSSPAAQMLALRFAVDDLKADYLETGLDGDGHPIAGNFLVPASRLPARG
jgi:hypothetical protein